MAAPPSDLEELHACSDDNAGISRYALALAKDVHWL